MLEEYGNMERCFIVCIGELFMDYMFRCIAFLFVCLFI